MFFIIIDIHGIIITKIMIYLNNFLSEWKPNTILYIFFILFNKSSFYISLNFFKFKKVRKVEAWYVSSFFVLQLLSQSTIGNYLPNLVQLEVFLFLIYKIHQIWKFPLYVYAKTESITWLVISSASVRYDVIILCLSISIPINTSCGLFKFYNSNKIKKK